MIDRDTVIDLCAAIDTAFMKQEVGTYNEFDKYATFALHIEAIVRTEEREACASIEVHLTTPDRDYTNMSPLDAYEAALIDAAIAFREAIRARGTP